MELEGYTPPQDAQELMRRYHAGERRFTESDLAPDDDLYYDLRGVTLEGADLSHSWIHADFRGANLGGVRFHHCHLKGCDFRGANLTGADFTESGIDAAMFAGAILDRADFTGAGNYGYYLKPGENPQDSLSPIPFQ